MKDAFTGQSYAGAERKGAIRAAHTDDLFDTHIELLTPKAELLLTRRVTENGFQTQEYNNITEMGLTRL